ncbi:VOC family protein [Paractinoplanes toevensis]|uniref:Glyoxalase n=1 Tax=Paractinoplanes toevensis TaxID=571911 RepID=A0A919TEB1_9ACTN|nr:VOC family protein [Actinoplanes toevensis]GIM94419.1 glyoxalase [Actinoplanes toevensis]
MPLILHHLAVTAADLETGRVWYDAFLGALGYKPGTVDPAICTWGGVEPEILLYPVEGDDRALHTHGRPGSQHFAFAVDGRDLVDAVHDAVVKVGTGLVVHPPQEYDYMPGYYAVFVEDPSGVRWEILTMDKASA